MRTWLARARRMTAGDYLTALEVLGLAVWVEAAIRLMPFSRVLGRIRRDTSAAVDASATAGMPGAQPEYQRLLRFVAVAYEILPFPPTCLRQSLVLYGLLERRGRPSRFCLGVAKSGAALDAHAWIECDGVTEPAAAQFSQLGELPIRPRL
jgi:hypothetical protein